MPLPRKTIDDIVPKNCEEGKHSKYIISYDIIESLTEYRCLDCRDVLYPSEKHLQYLKEIPLVGGFKAHMYKRTNYDEVDI